MDSSGQQESVTGVPAALPNPEGQETRVATEKSPLGIALLLAPFLGMVVYALAIVVLRRTGVEVDLPDELGGLAFYLLWGVGALWYASRACLKPGRLFTLPEQRTDWRFVAVVVPLMSFSLTGFYLQLLAASFAFPQHIAEWLAEPEPNAATSPLDTILLVLSMAAVGPIVEEVIFRGVLFPLWSRRWGFRAGIVGTSLLFGVLHADVVGSLVFGAIMAILYCRTGSLMIPIVAHMLFNAMTYIPYPGGTNDPVTLAEFRGDWMEPTAVFAVSLVILVAFLRWGVSGGQARPPAFSRGD